MKYEIPRYLYFSRLERIGTAALLFVVLAAWFYPGLVARLYPEAPIDFFAFEKATMEYYATLENRNNPESVSEPFFFDPNQAGESEFRRLGLSPRVASAILRYREKGGRFKKPTDFKKIYLLSEEDYERLEPWIKLDATGEQRPVYAANRSNKPEQHFELFDFNPNHASEEELLLLGIPAAAARSVVNYRSKGGVFRKKEDLKKIYTLPEAVYTRLEPYIRMETVVQEKSISSEAKTPGKPVPSVLDGNLATVADWQKLPGIGAWRAQQIVAYRDRLGGFVNVSQMAEVQGMPDSVFQKIVPFVNISGNGVRKIPLNTATVDALKAHPYFSAKQARLIVNYRDQHGLFKSADELLRLSAVVDAAWLERVGVYLDVR